jgi:hypothetical protein
MEMSIREHCLADIASTKIGIFGSTEAAYLELEAATKNCWMNMQPLNLQ